MAIDTDALSAQVDRVVELINEAITIITNPQTDNNSQSVVDALTIRLQGAADALSGAETPAPAPAPEPAPAPVADPAPVDTSGAPASDAAPVDAPADPTA